MTQSATTPRATNIHSFWQIGLCALCPIRLNLRAMALPSHRVQDCAPSIALKKLYLWAVFIISLALLSPTAVWAHECGPATLTVKEGGSAGYTITGSVPASFKVTDSGDSSVATITPLFIESSVNGDFTIQGVREGSTTFTIFWQGQQDETANGFCSVTVLVNRNQPPVADAGPDQIVTEGSLVVLDGTGSFDPDSDPLTFMWEQTAGPPVTLSDPTLAVTTFLAPFIGCPVHAAFCIRALIFRLTVGDESLFGDDTVEIQVLPEDADSCPELEGPEGAPDQEAQLGVLYDFRDEVLASTPTGERYIELFYRHAAEEVGLMFSYPELLSHARTLLERFLPTIQAVVAGQKVTVTAADLADIEALLEAFAAKASPELQADLRAIQEELQEGTVVGEFGITLRD